MRSLKTSEAAALLNVSSSTLRAWELRFGFPIPQRSPGGHRAYAHAEVAALRSALEGGVSISSAATRARALVAADSSSLVRALFAYDRELADRAIETALAFRSVERSVEEVLLPSLEEIIGRNGLESAAWAFSARWAADWLQRAMCLRGTFPSRTAVVLGDGSSGELDIDGLYIRALELFCRRAGLKVLRLSTRAVSAGSAMFCQCIGPSLSSWLGARRTTIRSLGGRASSPARSGRFQWGSIAAPQGRVATRCFPLHQARRRCA